MWVCYASMSMLNWFSFWISFRVISSSNILSECFSEQIATSKLYRQSSLLVVLTYYKSLRVTAIKLLSHCKVIFAHSSTQTQVSTDNVGKYTQVAKVIWHKTALPPQTVDSIVFTRWHQYAFPCGLTGATWWIQLNLCFLRPTQVHNHTLDCSSTEITITIINMNRKFRGRAGSPSNTKSPALTCTCIPSGILMHPTVWPQ